MVTDYEQDFIFLFGGILARPIIGNEYMNDLWKYYIEANKWEEVVPFGINAAKRWVNLWSGIFEDVKIDPINLLKDDVITFIPYNKSSSDQIELPLPRAGHTMILIGNPPFYILIFGGYYLKTEKNSDGSTAKIH